MTPNIGHLHRGCWVDQSRCSAIWGMVSKHCRDRVKSILQDIGLGRMCCNVRRRAFLKVGIFSGQLKACQHRLLFKPEKVNNMPSYLPLL